MALWELWYGLWGVFVTIGLYKWVRHPLYTGGLIIIWLMPLMTVNLLTLIALFTLYLIIGVGFEEKQLVVEFGETYRSCQREVPMLIPGFHRNRGENNDV